MVGGDLSLQTLVDNIVTFTRIKGLPSVNGYFGVSVDKDDAYAMLSKFRTSAVIATVIAVVIIIALLGMLIRVLLQPLHVMTRAMQDIADGEGDLEQQAARLKQLVGSSRS
ncbi:HAMP domain-containing protein [Pseudomonas sp. SJZ103]|nr:HAMP domain-containing protein [Pseudomonas sp. SJZ103]TWC81258.1 HAMP domain-containing protein [Pseudomonas sp. SJZ094]